jgi:hypothetical protein
MRIKDIADIRSGFQFRGKIEPDPDGEVSVIQIKDFDDDRQLQPQEVDRIVFERDPEPYRVEPGDVLFLSRGHRLFATTIDEPPQDAIATGYFFIMRMNNERVRPDYLAWYINSRSAQKIINTLKRGAHIPLISRGDIETLPIEMPPLEIQEKIVALDALARRERRLLAKLNSKRTELIEGICLAAVTGVIRPQGVEK